MKCLVILSQISSSFIKFIEKIIMIISNKLRYTIKCTIIICFFDMIDVNIILYKFDQICILGQLKI